MLPGQPGSTTPIKKFVLSERIMSKVVPGEVVQGEVVPGEVVDVESPPAAVVDAQFESDDGREEEEAIAPVKPSNWTCPVCKRPNGAQTQKCGVCGTRKDYNPDPERRQHEYAAEAERRRRAAEAGGPLQSHDAVGRALFGGERRFHLCNGRGGHLWSRCWPYISEREHCRTRQSFVATLIHADARVDTPSVDDLRLRDD